MSLADDPIAALTPREREVLALFAAGKTNVEIANELGIRFDTAKWHVSEVLSKLGVERREDAAKAWRRWQRADRRWARAAGAQVRERGALVAGSVAAVLGLVVLAVVLAALTRDDATAEPQVLLAIQNSSSGILVVNVTKDESVLEWSNDEGYQVGPRFSPDGSRVAVLIGGTFEVRAASIELENGREHVSELMGASAAGVPVWSPDGTRVAMAGPAQMTILTPEMELLGESDPEPLENAEGPWGEPQWSPDSRHVVAWTSYAIVVSTRDGESAVYTYADLSAEAPGGLGVDPERDGPALLRWMDDGRLRIDIQRNANPPIDNENHPTFEVAFGELNGTTFSWTELRSLTDEELTTFWPIPVATQDELAVRAMALVVGSNREWVRPPWRTAEGSAWALSVPYAGPDGSNSVPDTAKLVVFADDPVVFELPYESWQGFNRTLDVVIVE
jgi:DNA-binding CsgD family transcriptional regulator